MSTRNNFEFTSNGKLLCNEFVENDTTYASSNDLPFYSSADYIACSDSLDETIDEKIVYNTNGKALSCFEIIEGNESDYDFVSAKEQKYVMGSATTFAELYANFDPTWDIDVANSRVVATNFDNFKAEIQRLGGDYTSCRVLVVEKKWKKSLYSYNKGKNNEDIRNINNEIYPGYGYIIRAGATHQLLSGAQSGEDYAAMSDSLKDIFDNQKDFERDGYSTSDISSLLSVITYRYLTPKSWHYRNNVFYGIVYYAYTSGFNTTYRDIYNNITRLPRQFIQATFINGRCNNISPIIQTNPIKMI